METTEKRHYAIIEPYKRKLTLKYEDQIVAETENALILKEVGRSVYDPVYYIPKEDLKVEMEMEPGTKGVCPIKGHSHNWYLKGNKTSSYFGWSYEDPLPRSKKIKGHIAFNSAYITFISAPL